VPPPHCFVGWRLYRPHAAPQIAICGAPASPVRARASGVADVMPAKDELGNYIDVEPGSRS
jgi:hypothetical protein